MIFITKKDITDRIKDNNVKFIRLMFSSLIGTVKNVEVPVSQVEEVLNNNIIFDGSSIDGFARIIESDMYLYPDLSTFKIINTESSYSTGIFICDIYTSSRKPFEGDPRGNLKRILKKLKKYDITNLKLGAEPEFFLLKKATTGNIISETNDQGGYFDYSPLDKGENCRRDIVLELENMGFEVEAAHHEVANGQHEINFKYANALDACDNIQLFKIVVKSVARKHNLHATFMPKPFEGMNGSGMHCNLSLYNGNENIFYDKNKEYHLSDTCRYFINGLLKNAKYITAFCNPTVNSYKRLVSGYEAPTNIAWSPLNRSPLIRVPASRGLSTRVELRSVDPSCNPYIAIASILTAGLNGIDDKMEHVKPSILNLYELDVDQKDKLHIEELPKSLEEAVNLLKTNKVAKSSVTKYIYEKFILAKENEISEYNTAISDYEFIKYIDL